MGLEIAYGLAFTQKDDLKIMRGTAAHYSESCTAYTHKDILPFRKLQDELYFKRGCIPGMAYDEFLNGSMEFLACMRRILP